MYGEYSGNKHRWRQYIVNLPLKYVGKLTKDDAVPPESPLAPPYFI